MSVPLGAASEEGFGGLAQQGPGAGQDHEGDRDGRDDVGALPAGAGDDNGGGDHGEGTEGDAEDLEVGALDVQTGLGSRAQQDQSHDVRDQADRGEGEQV